MKIEIGESLCYSYLRHVMGCWLVQTNWKSSEHWTKRMTEAELEDMFREMREEFDPNGNVFKQTTNVVQFMRQGEIDVVGIDQDSGIHAIDVAFHEGGLIYGGDTASRVLKKMLRTYILLNAYHPAKTKFQIYFISPKVGKRAQSQLQKVFADLQRRYPETVWHLITNEDCNEQVVRQTLEKAATVADTSELFVRSVKLLSISDMPEMQPQSSRSSYERPDPQRKATGEKLQNLVRGLMITLLDECPTILDDQDLRNLMDGQYCDDTLSLKIAGLGLLRDREEGRSVSGHDRYWKDLYGGRFYVCNNWWKAHRFHNANSLLEFLGALAFRNPQHPDISEIDKHRTRLREFIGAGDS